MSDSLQLHNCSTPVFPVPHHFPEFAQVHVHCISDDIQSSYPLSPSSPLAFNLSQCPGLFQWISSSHKVAKVLELQLQHQSFQWVSELISFRIDWLDLLPVQGTLKNLLQPHSLKASIYCYPKTNTSVLQKMMSLLIQKLGRQWTAILEDIYRGWRPTPHLASSGSILPVLEEPLLLPLSPCDSDKMLHALVPRVVLWSKSAQWRVSENAMKWACTSNLAHQLPHQILDGIIRKICTVYGEQLWW